MELHTTVLSRLQRLLGAQAAARLRLERSLLLLAKWRCVLIQNTIVEKHGAVVQSGPFEGMRFVRKAIEGCHVPKLLGTYEHALHPHIEAAIARGYAHVVNIGMAEGYYAVGLARRLPHARIHAFDRNEQAHAVCRSVAELNGVADRVEIAGLFAGEDFATYPPEQTLVICDIEGGEEALLDPDEFPALRGFDLIVELHETFSPDITRLIAERFAASHDIVVVCHKESDATLPDSLAKASHLDRLLAVWEWRGGPTPWAVMTRKR